MTKHSARQPWFKRLSQVLGIRKKWYKQKVHRGNRKRLRQAKDIQEHVDKPLNPWDLD